MAVQYNQILRMVWRALADAILQVPSILDLNKKDL
jgi:hypothetical protein